MTQQNLNVIAAYSPEDCKPGNVGENFIDN